MLPDRTIRAIALVLAATLAVGACQSSPVAPALPLSPSAPPVTLPNFAGEWRVVYHVESCIGRYCYISHINRDATIVLRLIQMGDRVTGLVGTADVEGVVAPDGRLSLRGFAPAAPLPLASSFELRQFDVRLDSERGMTGRLEYVSLMSGDYSAYSVGASGPIVSASRRPLDATSFNGTWRGYYARTSCVPADSCRVAEQDEATIELEDTGGPLRGTVTLWPSRFQVAGLASGTSAELRGQSPWGRDATADALVRVERSQTGRLTGAVELVTSTGQSRVFTLLSVVPSPTAE